MHGGGSSGDRKRARIEIIPLIDVIFFLLATFVLFTLSLSKSGGIPVTMPTSSTGEPRDPNGSITISVTENGSLAWDKDSVKLDEFLIRLQTQYKQDPETKILINGDERAFMSQVIYVFNEVRKAGFPKVLIETRVRPAGQQ